jgi:hypothetical protein
VAPPTSTPISGDDAESLRTLSHRCRCLARGASRKEVADSLVDMAETYSLQAERAEAEAAADPKR